MLSRYLIALGSNVRHCRHGAPEAVLRAAFAALADERGLRVERRSRVVRSDPLGPSRRRYANAAAIVSTGLSPPELLTRLHGIEARFGRNRRGRRWGARVLDLDLVLWSEGAWCSPGLVIPHTAFRTRTFVLQPAVLIAGDWRDPLTGLTTRHHFARLTRPHRAPR